MDDESGLIYLRARYYDPGLGRFISEDPIKDGMNWYVYCGGDPVMFIDPSGLTFIIGWSYSGAEVVEYVEYKASNGVTISTNTDDWDSATWSDFTQRNSFARAAYTRKDELIAMGIPESDICMQRIDDRTDLEGTWDMWASYSLVEGLDIYSHGHGGGPEIRGGSGDFWESAKKLNFGDSIRSHNGVTMGFTAYASFHGCNTANGTFAQNFANTQGVTTNASTNFTSFSKKFNQFSAITTHATSKPVYLAVYKEFEVLGVRIAKTSRVPMKIFTPQN